MFSDSLFQLLTPKQIIDFNNFKKFIMDNSVIPSTVGVLVAYASWNFIQSFVGDLVLPGIYYLLINPFISNDFISDIFAPVNKLNIAKFITEFFSFILIIVFTYLFIQYIINNWMDKSSLAKEEQTQPSPQVIQGNTVTDTLKYDTSNFKAYSKSNF